MSKKNIEIDAIRHKDASRLNIPTAEYESVMRDEDKTPIQVAYERRNRDLDPQLVWRGKDAQDWSDLVVNAPPLYIQEKVHPKVLIDDLRRRSKEGKKDDAQVDLFADFNGLKDKEAATEFYQHDQHWSNRMILGDSLAVMASLAEREGLRGKVQCIYFDPPYGIKFQSNFQWSTTSRDVKDGSKDHVTREPEMVKAFRDTWRDGIHTYLSYLRDRFTVARDLLHESGSIFVQIGDENVHRVRTVLDEVFGDHNFVASILYRTTGGLATNGLSRIGDNVLWYSKNVATLKVRQLFQAKSYIEDQNYRYLETQNASISNLTKSQQLGSVPIPEEARVFRFDNAVGQGAASIDTPMYLNGTSYRPPKNTHWKANYPVGMERLRKAGRLYASGKTLSYKRYFDDYAVKALTATWMDTGVSGFASEKSYVVQTLPDVIGRCVLMSSDPGDLVLDPTCGSGTTAYVAEQWGRRWITIDTSRVSLALARSRIMGARYPYYYLADSLDGQKKEAEIARTPPKTSPTQNNIRHGFVYERMPHVTLGDIARNSEIDVIWEKRQPYVEAALEQLNHILASHNFPFKVETGARSGVTIHFTSLIGATTLPVQGEMPDRLMEWEVPRSAPENWPSQAKIALIEFWDACYARQKDIDASISAKAESEHLYDRPYSDPNRIRVAGPFTVESLSPHRVLAMSDDDELIDVLEASEGKLKAAERDHSVKDFGEMVLENLRAAGVQQADKNARISFTSVTGWPGHWISGEARYLEGDTERRAGILIGPEFGTISRPDLVAAAREAGDAGFDILVACAFNFDAHSAEFDRLGKVPVLKARMNPDLMMGDELKATGAGNLFVVFGEPDIKMTETKDGQIQVQVFGVDVFKPQTGEVESEGTDGIALWMIDTDYNEESFFVRHCYFLGANDPYKALKTTLKAEIDQEAWDSLNSDISRPFPKPKSGRIAVKVINHLGDEVMKVFSVN